MYLCDLLEKGQFSARRWYNGKQICILFVNVP